jgi:hypothetical protein
MRFVMQKYEIWHVIIVICRGSGAAFPFLGSGSTCTLLQLWLVSCHLCIHFLNRFQKIKFCSHYLMRLRLRNLCLIQNYSSTLIRSLSAMRLRLSSTFHYGSGFRYLKCQCCQVPPSLHCHFSPKPRPFWYLPRPHTIKILFFMLFLGLLAIN